jgi:hypothetical protein
MKKQFIIIFALFFSQLVQADPRNSIANYATDPFPWLHIEANSEQRQPVYLGRTPRELELNFSPREESILLPEALKSIGEEQALIITENLQKNGIDISKLEFEAWPVRNDIGQLTWAFARYKEINKKSWGFLNYEILPDNLPTPEPFLPVNLDISKNSDFNLIFNDVLSFDDLYVKPVFGDCVWTNKITENIINAWLPLREMIREGYESRDKICRLIPQPSRLNGKPYVFIISVDNYKVIFPSEIIWKENKIDTIDNNFIEPKIKSWPENFEENYREDVMILSGEKEAVFPLSNKRMRFIKKNNIEKDNHLDEIVEYLEERYKQLGIQTFRQNFTWRGEIQTNLIAIIPGLLKEDKNKPVLMADHFDTAFCEEIFEKTKERVAAPGADDNMSATAVLLRAAEILKDSKPKHDIWLLHITGEEYPADDLGARYFVSELLKEKKDITGLVLMDMIGWREKDDKIFQVNAGDSVASLKLATLAIDSASGLTEFVPVLRTRFDKKSYLYNTDGLIFSDAGYPVILFNEHINREENFSRDGYHKTTDTSKKIDFKYAADIGKVAIETVAKLAL